MRGKQRIEYEQVVVSHLRKTLSRIFEEMARCFHTNQDFLNWLVPRYVSDGVVQKTKAFLTVVKLKGIFKQATKVVGYQCLVEAFAYLEIMSRGLGKVRGEERGRCLLILLIHKLNS